jgi:uncharacterized protein involved in outer membrane biogenesis
MTPRFLSLVLSRRVRRWGLVAAAAVGLYALAGFFVLPSVLKSQIPQRAGRLLGREVRLERVRTNPFTLSITIEGLRILDRDGQDLLAWRRLYVNADLWPLLRGRMSLQVIDLDAPRFRVVLEKGGRLNFSDILDRLQGTPSSGSSEPTPVAIGHLRVTGAQLSFQDRSLPEPFATTLGPLGLDLEHFRTEQDARSPYAFSGRTEAGERFAWRGTVSATPLRSNGSVELAGLQLPKYEPYYRDQVGFRLDQGRADAKAAYDFEWSAARHAARISDGEVTLAGLSIAGRNEKAPAVQLEALAVSGIAADLLERRAEVASVRLDGLKAKALRTRDGLNLVALFQVPEKPVEPAAQPFRLLVHQLSLANGAVACEDQVPARPVRLGLDRIEGTVKELSLEPDHVSPVELSLRAGERGSLHAQGTLALLQGTGELDVKGEGLELPPLDPYLDAVSNIRLSRGRLAFEGHLVLTGGKAPDLGYRGGLRVADFEARDGRMDEPFLRWKELRLSGIDFTSRRPAFSVKTVAWSGPEAHLVMAQDGSSNVARALQVEAPGPVASAVPPTPAAPALQPLARIARLDIHGGRLSFIDRSLQPNAALLLSGMEGQYTGLSTEAEEATQVDFKGLAGGLASIRIQGRAMPLRHDRDTDVAIRIDGADLTDFSPYAGKYLGYTIRQGKLILDARVRIQDRKLNIEDKVILDRMYLGDKVDSPDATHLPVRLGLAILRDRKGVIELDVPVDGSLDEPDIHYGRVIWKAVLGALGKVITSPFALLSKLFGGGEDLSMIAFAPGDAAVPPAERKKLETLLKSLTERPELKLELEGATDASDLQVFRAQGLERLLRRAKWSARQVKVPATPEEEVIDPSEREKWIRAAYNAAFPPPAGVQVAEAPVPEMEKRLAESVQVDPETLRQLARAREEAAIGFLMQGGQVEADRIFRVQGGDSAKAGGSRVYFNLR